MKELIMENLEKIGSSPNTPWSGSHWSKIHEVMQQLVHLFITWYDTPDCNALDESILNLLVNCLYSYKTWLLIVGFYYQMYGLGEGGGNRNAHSSMMCHCSIQQSWKIRTLRWRLCNVFTTHERFKDIRFCRKKKKNRSVIVIIMIHLAFPCDQLMLSERRYLLAACVEVRTLS